MVQVIYVKCEAHTIGSFEYSPQQSTRMNPDLVVEHDGLVLKTRLELIPALT